MTNRRPAAARAALRRALGLAALLLAAAAPSSLAAAEPDPPTRQARTAEAELVPLTAFCKVLGTAFEGATDRPVAGATVELAGARQLTRDNGLFEFDPVLVGRYALTVRARGYEPATVVVYATPPLATVRVELAPVMDSCPLPPAPEGPPVARDFPDRTIVLNPPAPEPPPAPRRSAAAKRPPKPAPAAAEGGGGIASGRPDPTRSRGTAEVSVERPVHAADGFGTIEGRVTERGTDAPVAGAIVEIGPRAMRAETDGRYRISGVPAGRYTLVFTRKGFRPANLRLTVRRDAVSAADVALEPEGVAVPPASAP